MAFNRKPEKQILQQHRFEEFNQNSISKLISLRSTTHWHVLAESEQLQRESWNNTLSGPLAIGPHRVGAQELLACYLLIMLDHFREHWWGPPRTSTTASCRPLSVLPQGVSQTGRVARELACPGGKTTGLFCGEKVYHQQLDYSNPQGGYQIQTFG